MEPHSARESVFENENRLLAQFPSFTAETVRDGSFTEGYEEYLADQFPVRDSWISLKTRTELLSGRREINNVFIGKGNWLIDKYDGTLSQERIDGNLKLLGDFTTYAAQTLGQDHVRVLLVPTASAVLTDKLPPFAHDFDQQALLDEAASLCPGGNGAEPAPAAAGKAVGIPLLPHRPSLDDARRILWLQRLGGKHRPHAVEPRQLHGGYG